MKKAIVIFYSYSGNTQKIADILCRVLKTNYNADSLALQSLDESDSFFKQALRAFLKKKAIVAEGTKFDLSEYDLVAIGTPVWAFAMAPAVRTFLDKCASLNGKSVLLFATYGSGVGKDKCIQEMEKIVKAKGASSTKSFSIQQFKIEDTTFVSERIKEILKNE